MSDPDLAPMWYVEDVITGAKIASQNLDREETIEQLEEALALATGEKENPLKPVEAME